MMSLADVRRLAPAAAVAAAWGVLAVSLLLLAVSLVNIARVRTANEAIAGLLDRKDIPVDAASAPSELALARINELLRRDRYDEAQNFTAIAAPSMPPQTRSAAVYNVANAEVHRALAELAKGDLDSAAARVNLAKAGYRLALRLDPGNWDARNNLDVAMRIVRDLPVSEGQDQNNPKRPSTNWTDLPGAPKGLP